MKRAKTAVLAADVTGQTSVSLIILPGGVVLVQESLVTGYEWDNAI